MRLLPAFMLILLTTSISFAQLSSSDAVKAQQDYHKLPALEEIQAENNSVEFKKLEQITALTIHDVIRLDKLSFTYITLDLADPTATLRGENATNFYENNANSPGSHARLTNVAFHEATNSYILADGFKRIPPVTRN